MAPRTISCEERMQNAAKSSDGFACFCHQGGGVVAKMNSGVESGESMGMKKEEGSVAPEESLQITKHSIFGQMSLQ